MTKRPSNDCTSIWDLLRQEYVALRPRFPSLREPAHNYLQLNVGGKAAHYEWKVLHAPRSLLEVALHFEAASPEENLEALALVEGRAATIRGSTLTPFVSGRWGGKWTRVGFQVDLVGDSDDGAVRQSAELMQLLVERTYPLVKNVLDRSAETGWPAA